VVEGGTGARRDRVEHQAARRRDVGCARPRARRGHDIGSTDPRAAIFTWAMGLAEAITANPVTWRLMLIPPAGTPEIVRERVQRGRDIALAAINP
jgi:hypothetical protein